MPSIESAPVTILVDLHLAPEAVDGLKEIEAAVGQLNAGAGTNGTARLHRDADDPQHLVATATFESAEALARHDAAPETPDLAERLRPFLAAPPMRTVTVAVPTVDTPGAPSPEEINIRWGEAFNAGDAEAMLSLYEPDALLVPGPGQEPVRGAALEASVRWLTGLRATVTYEPRYWLRYGEFAVGSISFHIVGVDESGAPIELRGTTAEFARRQSDGTWKYVVDHPFAGP